MWDARVYSHDGPIVFRLGAGKPVSFLKAVPHVLSRRPMSVAHKATLTKDRAKLRFPPLQP
eukprot:8538-Pyramimonas_sp.AAC.1